MRCGKHFLEELDLDEPDSPVIASAARRRKRPGATSRALKQEAAQLEHYERDPAPRTVEIEALLRALHAKEQAG